MVKIILTLTGRPAQPPGADVGQAREGGVLVVPRSFGGREDGAREARHDADRRGHRLPVQRLLRLAVARGRRAGVGRQGRVGGPPPQRPVPVLAGLMDGNGCSIGTHILSYKPVLSPHKNGAARTHASRPIPLAFTLRRQLTPLPYLPNSAPSRPRRLGFSSR